MYIYIYTYVTYVPNYHHRCRMMRDIEGLVASISCLLHAYMWVHVIHLLGFSRGKFLFHGIHLLGFSRGKFLFHGIHLLGFSRGKFLFHGRWCTCVVNGLRRCECGER